MRFRRQDLPKSIVMLFALSCLPTALAAQTGAITGRVVDSEGNPISDVQISLENTTLGTLTNEEGRYLILNIPVGVYQVNAERLGLETRHVTGVRVQSDRQAVVDFTMTNQVLNLEELVVTGTVDPIEGVKVPFTVNRVSTENLQIPTTHTALAAIQGKVAGTSIIRPSGQPGSGTNILLRTPTSVERSNTPMFVVDGVVLGSLIGKTLVDLESLDIESVEVVKGAAAASLYGSRAAAGVIRITSKRGSNLGLDRTQIRVRSEYGTSQLPRRIPVSNTHQYLQADNGDWVDEDGNVVGRDNRVEAPDFFMDNPYMSPLYDNFDAIFVPDRMMLNTVSVARNSQDTNFLASFTNYDERGNYPGNDGFQRNSFRLNVDHRIGDAVTFTTSAFHSRSRQDDLDSSPFWNLLIGFEPDIDLAQKDSSGQYIQVPDPRVQRVNPLWSETQTEDFDNNTRTLLSGEVRWRPISNFSLYGNVSYDRADRFNEYYGPKGLPLAPWEEQPWQDGYMSHHHHQNQAMNGYVGATYIKTLGELTVRPTVRAFMEREKYEYTGAWVTGLGIGGVRDLDAGMSKEASSSWREVRATGYLGQVGLDWKGKYIVDALGRRDGSSLFGQDARWNNYYRVAGSYRMAEEPWWPFESINEFKLRYAIGTAGGRPNYADRYEVWTFNVDAEGNTSVGKGNLGNRSLRPELTTEQDMGVDIIFNRKYSLQLSYIKQRTEDLLISVPLAAVAGYENQIQNTGVQSGTTWEATLQAQLVNTPDLSWSMDFVADRSRVEIDEWNRSCYVRNDLQYVCEGSSLGDMWGESYYRSMEDLPDYLPKDQFQVNDDGYVVWVGEGNSFTDGVSKDLWGTASFTDDTGNLYQWGIPFLVRDSLGVPVRSVIGQSLPDLSFGWLNNFRWRDFTAHFHFQGQIGGNVYSRSQQRMYQYLRHKDVDQSGKEEGLKKPLPYYRTLYNSVVSTAPFVGDAQHLRLRTVQLTYTLGPSPAHDPQDGHSQRRRTAWGCGEAGDGDRCDV